MDGGAPLRVTLLGAFQVFRGETALPVQGARLQGLVVRLALAGGRAVQHGALIEAIWSGEPPAGPVHALQALVSRLRRTLGSPGDVEQLAGGYRLALDAADVDVLRFDQLAAAGRERLRAGDPKAAAALLGEAVALWGDRPGAEPAVVAAVAPAIAIRLSDASVEAVADLADAELTLGRADTATAGLTGLLAESPVHERAAALLMDALAAQGRQAEALARYERIREALAEELGIDPGVALRERHLRLLRAEVPAVDTTQRNPSNLPAPVTSLIGREDDLARAETLLAAGRLVTVLGPGGSGKTRLAVEAARRGEHRDGTWMIDLASITEPSKVGAAVLAGIGLRDTAMFEVQAKRCSDPPDELEVLAEQLSGRECLLVMDSCEHLIDAVAHLVSALLARCAGPRVLATSREPLAIDGEGLVPLGPLPLPDPDADAEHARRTSSVRLFSERAAGVRPGFGVDEYNLGDVLRVVRSLDGLPLALELAAARLRTRSLADLAAGLSDRFRMLTTGSRTAVPRHRTLQAVIAWSWDLLDTNVRTVAERISVLPGGVTSASAIAVCAGSAVPEGAIPELLADLVDRSLLQLAPDTGRCRMLETVREYGVRQLAERGTLTGVRGLAARHFAELVARYDPLLRGPTQLDAIHVLRVEYDNVLAALRHRCDIGDAGGAVELALNLTWYWQLLGRRRDAVYWLGEAIALPVERPNVQRDVAEGLLLLTAQDALVNHSITERWARLRKLADRLPSYPELPSFPGALLAVRLARTAATGALPTSEGPDVWLAGLARLLQAQSAEARGRLDPVRSDVTVALEYFVRAGDRWGQAAALPLRALLRQYDGDLDGALADLNEAKRLAGEFGSLSLSDEIFIDLRWGDLQARLGERARAVELIAATRQRALHSSVPEMAILLDAQEAVLRVRLGDSDRARELVDAADVELADRGPFGGNHGRALVDAARGALCVELGDGPGAEESLGRAYAAAACSADMPLAATVALTVAGLAALYGRHCDAAATLGAAARLRGAHDGTDPQVRTLSARSRAALGDQRFAEAYECGWQLAAPSALTRVNPALLSRATLPADSAARPALGDASLTSKTRPHQPGA